MWAETFKSFLSIAIELTVLFVVISFVVNLVQAYIPYEKVEKYLSGRNKGVAAAFALLFAFVTPFCSCSTIPVVVNMLKKRMPFSIVMIFLFSSPVLIRQLLRLWESF